jgi:hypothetical protein
MAIEVNVVGFDIAKIVFQVHGVGRRGDAVLRKRLRRAGQVQIPSEPEGENPQLRGRIYARSLSQLLHQSSGRKGPGPYILPAFRTSPSTVSDEGKGKENV